MAADPDIVEGVSFRRRLATYQAGLHGPKPDSIVARRLRAYDRRLRMTWHKDAGSWALWLLTPRYVPMGTWDGVRLTVAADVPQLLVIADHPYVDQLAALDWIKRADTYRLARGRMERVDRIEAAEVKEEAAVQQRTDDRIAEGVHHWNWQGATIKSYVPGNYVNNDTG